MFFFLVVCVCVCVCVTERERVSYLCMLAVLVGVGHCCSLFIYTFMFESCCTAMLSHHVSVSAKRLSQPVDLGLYSCSFCTVQFPGSFVSPHKLSVTFGSMVSVSISKDQYRTTHYYVVAYFKK